MNGFDGVLTILGVLAGSYFGDIRSAASVATLGLATAVAMSVSGSYGAYMAEKAERRRALSELEESTLSDLSDTDISDASIYATLAVALVNGISPFTTAAIAISPFYLGSAIKIETAYYAAVSIAFIELFLLGGYLGAISRDRIIYSGIKMVTAGIICVLIAYLVGGAA